MLDALSVIQTENSALQTRFADKLRVNQRLSCQLVSFQANKAKPVYRWFKYKEGFSESLVQYLLNTLGIERGMILDPFAGTGTTLFTASECRLDSVGIELLPVGCEVIEVRQQIVGRESELRDVLNRWRTEQPWQDQATPETASFDGLITSPPYANRYDYTRTYALELAMLGVDEAHLRRLRQVMVSCTVEDKEKSGLDQVFTPERYKRAVAAFETQHELQRILAYLEQQRAAKALNNPGIPRMVRNYFFELALIIFECSRLLKPGAPFVMVNDNVRYGGATIPVDLILSDFAEQAGFDVEAIWVLPTGKGNSSQQMGVHGREELRKCIYIWRRKV